MAKVLPAWLCCRLAIRLSLESLPYFLSLGHVVESSSWLELYDSQQKTKGVQFLNELEIVSKSSQGCKLALNGMWKRFRFMKIYWRLKCCCCWEVRRGQSMLLLHKTNRWYYWEEVQYHPWRFLERACIGCSAIDGHLWVITQTMFLPWWELCIRCKFQSLNSLSLYLTA